MLIQPSSANDAAFALDPKGVDALRQSARQNSPEALKTAAKQFEGLFMNMIMKSMRDATPKDGALDSEQGKMFTSMLDQQLSQNLAKRGVGLADMLIRQLSKDHGVAPAAAGDAAGAAAGAGAANMGSTALDPSLPGRPPIRAIAADAGTSTSTSNGASTSVGTQPGLQSTLETALESGIPGVLRAALTGVRATATAFADASVADAKVRSSRPAHILAFEDKMSASAEEAARSTGIPAKFMLGQAALESGWGKREIRSADGSSSHNVFGIKATASWTGKVVTTATTEYVNGVPERRIERFKAYDSYGDAFRDYAKTLQNNPRYQSVLANAQDVNGFAQGLQRAGYATDPNYAAKLTRIITHSLSA